MNSENVCDIFEKQSSSITFTYEKWIWKSFWQTFLVEHFDNLKNLKVLNSLLAPKASWKLSKVQYISKQKIDPIKHAYLIDWFKLVWFETMRAMTLYSLVAMKVLGSLAYGLLHILTSYFASKNTWTILDGRLELENSFGNASVFFIRAISWCRNTQSPWWNIWIFDFI